MFIVDRNANGLKSSGAVFLFLYPEALVRNPPTLWWFAKVYLNDGPSDLAGSCSPN